MSATILSLGAVCTNTYRFGKSKLRPTTAMTTQRATNAAATPKITVETICYHMELFDVDR